MAEMDGFFWFNEKTRRCQVKEPNWTQESMEDWKLLDQESLPPGIGIYATASELKEMHKKAKAIYDTISATPLPSSMFVHPAPSESILSEAKRLVEGGERNQQYGPPEMDFARIASMVTALLRHKLKDGEIVLDSDVARIMICLKLSRSVWQGKRDNWVDIAGYAACGHRCETGEW